MRSTYRLFLCCLAALLPAGLLIGQSSLGSITGIVKDNSGAVIPQAQVTLSSVHTGLELRAKTDSAGDYLFSNLQPGVYTVAVSRTGFRQVRSGDITLTAAEHMRFDVTLQVGTARQTVTVQATPPALNTENGHLSNTVTQREILTMPLALGQRNDEIAFLNLQSSTYTNNYDTNLGGARGTSTNWTIDGISANSALFGNEAGNMVDEDIDAVQDLKADTSNNSAEYPQIGSVFISDRSGTNTFHGSLSEYENNWAFDARPFYSTSKPQGPIASTYAGSIGGPVILPGYNGRDKTFFFFAYERHENPGVTVNTAQVPTAAMMQGDFSQLLPEPSSPTRSPVSLSPTIRSLPT